MYISLYDEDRQHITNILHVTYDITTRAFDSDNFSGEGISDEDINDAVICVLNDENGNYKYACFVDTITPDKDSRTVKGLDFITLWDTEILLDYTEDGSFDGALSAIFTKVKNLVFNGSDVAVNKIPVEVIIPDDDTDTAEVYGSYQGTYQFVNAYDFLLCYLKYYGYIILSEYDVENGKIIFTFEKNDEANDGSFENELDINLSDFTYELTTSSSTTNKTVATIAYNVEENGTPRPSTLTMRYYYRTKGNKIVQSDAAGNIDGRIYPVVCKMFESEYLADAQYNAVYELANARFVDNIQISNNKLIDPVDFSLYPLYTMVNVYYNGKLYKSLPISEKQITGNKSGENIAVKLGFKKILLTEIIKG